MRGPPQNRAAEVGPHVLPGDLTRSVLPPSHVIRRVKAAAELYVDTRLRVAEEVRHATETVNQKLQRLRIGLQAQLNVGDG